MLIFGERGAISNHNTQIMHSLFHGDILGLIAKYSSGIQTVGTVDSNDA
ncbi:hypothetical protein AM1_3930 [Acaryochloris marina MBIC11017]|uniref:Uncharacterized protein n=1 Tax=Acaryochloris marina (strain MBIC 11017) TaxID=329726 RepID=B0C896_ACAM1|nr:hypothetical protein AM1_3930 [Acaryochloris marina MBIC11017]